MNKHYAYNSPFKMKDDEGNEYTLTVEYEDYAESPREWDNVCKMICWHRNYDLGDQHNYDDSDEFMSDILYRICGMNPDDYESLSTRDKLKLIFESGQIVIKPINLYDHSGITVSTSNSYPYNDRWDSCCVGFIYITKKKIFDDGLCLCEKDENGNIVFIEHKHSNGQSTYSAKTIQTTEENWKDVANHYIECEMGTYDQYVRGEVYWYKLTKKVIEQDICPHCGEVISEYEDEEEIDTCGGFYGDCLEDNGILDGLPSGIKFMED